VCGTTILDIHKYTAGYDNYIADFYYIKINVFLLHNNVIRIAMAYSCTKNHASEKCR